MKIVQQFVFILCICMSLASENTYRAAVIHKTEPYSHIDRYLPLIQEASRSNVDVLVLPSPESSGVLDGIASCDIENYDKSTRMLSEASKQAGMYVVAHLLERTVCENRDEVMRSSLVFDRDGNIVTVYRKPVSEVANCSSSEDIGTFTTDFGVTFGVLMDEDLVLQELDELKGLKNFVLTGSLNDDIPLLSVSQFAASWAFVNEANLISTNGIFAGKSGEVSGEADLVFGDLLKLGGSDRPLVPPVVSKQTVFPNEDLSLYTVKPLDLVAIHEGLHEMICHGDFCCNFFVKSKFIGPNSEELGMGLAAFEGQRAWRDSRRVAARSCALVACAGHYKRSCTIGSNNNSTDIAFEKISVTANFTNDHAQYPIVLTTSSDITPGEFEFVTSTIDNVKQVTLTVTDVENVSHFGIFGREFSKDTVKYGIGKQMKDSIGYIFDSEFDELFDYLWIRLRVMIFVVSIYFLEMM